MEKLTNGERLVLQLIKSLYSKNQSCFANNRRFLNNTNYKHIESVSRIISSLCKKGLIQIEYNQEKRQLIPVNLEVNPLDQQVNPPGPTSQPPLTNKLTPIDQQVNPHGPVGQTYNILYNTIIKNYNIYLNKSFFEKIESFNLNGISFNNYCYAIIEYGISNIYIRQADWKAGGAGLAIILNNNFINAIKKETGIEYIDTWIKGYIELDSNLKNEFLIKINNRKIGGLITNNNHINNIIEDLTKPKEEEKPKEFIKVDKEKAKELISEVRNKLRKIN